VVLYAVVVVEAHTAHSYVRVAVGKFG
jgi:hypothetical protein